MTIGKTAAITGACGIGVGIARAFANARRNWRLVDTDKVARMRHAKSSAEGRQRKTFNLDVRNREGYAPLADNAEAGSAQCRRITAP